MEQPSQQLSRRALLRWMTAAAAGQAVFPAIAGGAVEQSSAVLGYEPVAGDLPAAAPTGPPPAVAPPAGSTAPVFDIFGNFWSLAARGADGDRQLLVLPAQAPRQWLPDTLSSLPKAPWQYFGADEFGYVWIASATRCLRLDPHTPQAGWTDFTPDLRSAAQRHFGPSHEPHISAMGVTPSGAIAVALQGGGVVELDRDKQTTVELTPAPAGIERILSDARGDLWLRCAGKTFRRPAPPGAWQRRWETVDRLPAGDHDLSGDVLDGKFYMAGGQNAGWGYPAVPHVFRELFVFDPAVRRWSTAAQLPRPRYYNGTSFLDGRVWIIAGYTRDERYNPVRLDSVEIWEPATGGFTPGPSLPLPLDNPLAVHIDGRIYVAGSVLTPNSAPLTAPLRPCQLLSIGKGESAWRREPDGPGYQLALAGTNLGPDLYLALAGNGLGRFDTRRRAWSVVPMTHAARSPQMAAYRGEVWIMGGRDIEHQDAVTVYNPSTGSWRSGPDLPRPLAWGAATDIGGQLMVVGGAGGRSYNNRTFLLREVPLT